MTYLVRPNGSGIPRGVFGGNMAADEKGSWSDPRPVNDGADVVIAEGPDDPAR
jgi:hypothetical protein